MLVGFKFRIKGLRLTYGRAALRAAYVSKAYLQNHLVRIHLCVHHLKWSLSLKALPTGSLGCTRVMSVQP